MLLGLGNAEELKIVSGLCEFTHISVYQTLFKIKKSLPSLEIFAPETPIKIAIIEIVIYLLFFYLNYLPDT